jgi:phage gp36-like protein
MLDILETHYDNISISLRTLPLEDILEMVNDCKDICSHYLQTEGLTSEEAEKTILVMHNIIQLGLSLNDKNKQSYMDMLTWLNEVAEP